MVGNAAYTMPKAKQTPFVSAVTYGSAQGACEMSKFSDTTAYRGLVVMDQQAKEAVKAQIRLSGLQTTTEYDLRIMEFGNTTDDCKNVGEVFNPLAPKK